MNIISHVLALLLRSNVTEVVDVLDLLADLADLHKLNDGRKENRRNNCECYVDRTIFIKGVDGLKVKIPEGTLLVMYRNSRRTIATSAIIACFHHPGNQQQTVVYASGEVKSQDLTGRTLYNGKRRLPRIHLP